MSIKIVRSHSTAIKGIYVITINKVTVLAKKFSQIGTSWVKAGDSALQNQFMMVILIDPVEVGAQ